MTIWAVAVGKQLVVSAIFDDYCFFFSTLLAKHCKRLQKTTEKDIFFASYLLPYTYPISKFKWNDIVKTHQIVIVFDFIWNRTWRLILAIIRFQIFSIIRSQRNWHQYIIYYLKITTLLLGRGVKKIDLQRYFHETTNF